MKKDLLIGTLALLAMLLPAKMQAQLLATAQGNTLWGNVVYCQSWADDENMESNQWPVGIYNFKPIAPSITRPVCTDSRLNANGGGFYRDGKFCFFYYRNLTVASSLTYYETDVMKKEFTRIVENIEDKSLRATDLTYDRTTGNVYGQFYRNDLKGRCIGVLDQENLTHSNIINTERSYVGLAADKYGKLYGISLEGNLYIIDKTTGEQTKIGATGVIPGEYRMSATFDWTDNTFYWTCVHADGTSALYTIDTATGAATKVMDFRDNEQILGLYILPPAAADGAPAKVEPSVCASFLADATGTLSFTAPTKTYDGNELTGSISYTILDNGNPLLTGTTEPGAEVSREVTVEKGAHLFSVYTENAEGKSEESEPTKQWVGYDNPKAVKNLEVNLTKTADKTLAHITWEANPEGIHDGFVYGPELTYNVVRLPDNKVVAQGISECYADDEIDNNTELTSYSYKVVAYFDKMEGEPATTEPFAVGGSRNIPYDETFDTPESFDLFTVLDSNDDGKTWYYDEEEKAACYRFHAANQADDWLLTPALNLKSGKSYRLSFTVRCAKEWAPERIGVSFGQGDDPTTYTQLVKDTEIEHDAYGAYKQTFTPSEDGTFRIGFHAVSPGNRFKLYLKGIHVVEDEASGISNSTEITGDGNGKLFYDLTGRAAKSPKRGVNIVDGKKFVK